MPEYCEVELKMLDDTDEKGAAKSGPGEFEAILSVPLMDRDGEIIDSYAFEPLPKHITIDIDHGMSVLKTVGSGTPFYDDAGILRFKGTFASTQTAQEVRTLVREGHINKMSVAFHRSVWEPRDDGLHLTKGALLNAAIVAIPANQYADITSSKAAGEQCTCKCAEHGEKKTSNTPADGAAHEAAPKPVARLEMMSKAARARAAALDI